MNTPARREFDSNLDKVNAYAQKAIFWSWVAITFAIVALVSAIFSVFHKGGLL